MAALLDSPVQWPLRQLCCGHGGVGPIVVDVGRPQGDDEPARALALPTQQPDDGDDPRCRARALVSEVEVDDGGREIVATGRPPGGPSATDHGLDVVEVVRLEDADPLQDPLLNQECAFTLLVVYRQDVNAVI